MAASRHQLFPPRLLAFSFVAALFALLVMYGLATHWVPWSDECDLTPSCPLLAGETLAAIDNARHYVRDGPRYWYLQRHDVDGVSMIYFHNVNFGAFLAYGTSLLGAASPAPAALASAVAFCAGLAYAYLFVERASGSPRLALVFLLALGTELSFNTLLGLNLLRAWHWLPLFGVAFHTLALAGASRIARSHVLGVVGLSTIGFGVGYDFFAFVVALAACVALAYGSLRRPRTWLVLGFACAIPVVTRQLQVIGGVGFEVWATDFYVSAALKSPMLRSLLPLPPPEEVDAWYQAHGIFRGVANNTPMSEAMVELLKEGRLAWWADGVGVVTLVGAALGLGAALICGLSPSRRVPGKMQAEARTVLVVAAGQILGFLIFGYHALYYFVVQHEIPMIVVPIFLAVAFALAALMRLARRGGVATIVAGVLALLLVGERLVLQWHHLRLAGIRAHPEWSEWGDFALRPDGGGNDALALTVVGVLAAVVLLGLAWVFLRSSQGRSLPPSGRQRRAYTERGHTASAYSQTAAR